MLYQVTTIYEFPLGVVFFLVLPSMNRYKITVVLGCFLCCLVTHSLSAKFYT